jgi:large subunit ribosomal protein L16
MLSPKRTKFRKQHKGRIHGLAKSGTDLAFGSYGLKAMAPERITARQIEAARRAMTRRMRRIGKVWIRIFPDVPVSSKPAEVRMGKGKGSPEFWVAKVKPGRIMFEIDGVSETIARDALALAAAKLPIPVKFVSRPAYLPIREEVIYEMMSVEDLDSPVEGDMAEEEEAATEGAE